MKFPKLILPIVVLALGVSSAYAKKEPKYEKAHQLTPEQSALVQKAIAREKVVIKNIQERTPLVEMYLQNMKPDVKLYQVPTSDFYSLNRVDFHKTFTGKAYASRAQSKHGFFKGSAGAFSAIGRALHLDKETFNVDGFTDMMFIDPSGFDQQHYLFSYVRREFLGSVRTWVFDVQPKVKGVGRFEGRVWIEDQDGNVVRFNGTYTESASEDNNKEFFHFDSWRMNMQPDLWLPVAVYVEESQRIEGGKQTGLRAQVHFWGYSLTLPTRESENVSVQVEGAVDQSADSQDVSPLQATRAWVSQAENNVIDRLVQAGLLAPPSDFDKTMEQVVVNLWIPNNLNFPDPVHCRIMLTTTVEATTIGNTILVSKGLIDTLPRNEEALAGVLAFELAHVALGHHIDTRYAFNDRLLFPDESSFQRIKMNHSDADNVAAAARAMELLKGSMYGDSGKYDLAKAGLYFEQLQASAPALKQLNQPKLGDSMLKEDGTLWMAALAKMAPKLNQDDTNQVAAQPLGSWLKTDPWDDKEYALNTKFFAPMNARDKMPFEVTPIFSKLQRYEDAQKAPQQPAGQQQAPAPAPGSGAQ
ncbi:MAG TPA: M48 family metalloprotease [Acidobacteriaceae bacterium]|nr:M48 family metalloprotease [Acidobacteriaceae bacterium]